MHYAIMKVSSLRSATRRILSVVAVSLLITGCGDDGGGRPDAGLGRDECLGTDDLAIFDSTVRPDAGTPPDGGMRPDAGPGFSSRYNAMQEVALACGLGDCLANILNEEGETECMRTCFDDGPLNGISQDCLGCAVETVQCAKQNCTIQCVANELECRNCLTEHCVPQLILCTGFEG